MSGAAEKILDSLKKLTDFQRATVRAACEKLTAVGNGPRRVLVADEVGLGKTLVARGVIAKLLLRKMQAEGDGNTLRVVYICSNQALAEENRKKLSIFNRSDSENYVQASSFGRLAELGVIQGKQGPEKLLEICTLTPATSFSLTNGDGNADERYIISRALAAHPLLFGIENWIEEYMRAGVQGAWEYARYRFSHSPLDMVALQEFHEQLQAPVSIAAPEMSVLQERGWSGGSWVELLRSGCVAEFPDALKRLIRSRLRILFVQSCAANLKADLFILDEFQRFKELVKPRGQEESEHELIASRVLRDRSDVCTLLLSATPFKALSHIDEEDAGEAHMHELQELMAFLNDGDQEVQKAYENHRHQLMSQLLNLPLEKVEDGSLNIVPRREIEAILRPMICRTERSQISDSVKPSVNALERHCNDINIAEIEAYIALDKVGEALKSVAGGRSASDVMRYFKSAPWSLSFLGDYQLRKQLERHRDAPEVSDALKGVQKAWLPYKSLDAYRLDLSRDAPHAKLRELIKVAMPEQAERMLWVPPSLPYYSCEGPFQANSGFSKTLLFSSLVLAPRALSGLVSYEAERRLKRKAESNYFGDRKIDPLLRLDMRSISPSWSLLYPCRRLRQISIAPGAGSLSNLRERVRGDLSADVEQLRSRFSGDEAARGNRWYAFAPFLLDRLHEKFLATPGMWLDEIQNFNDGKGYGEESNLAQISEPTLSLGPMPDDLIDYLTDLAIAGPAICFSRSIELCWKDADEQEILSESIRAAHAFVSMINKREPQKALGKVVPKGKPWFRVLAYCAAGNLQAVLDEYFHMLSGSADSASDAVDAVCEALQIQTSQITAQKGLPTAPSEMSGPRRREVRLHCHYAVPLGNQKSVDEQKLARMGHVRTAFNSPFWPFLLNSTSIGQEGLDFHWYCSRVVHWNLPSNPIDLEQREGRVNRYKSLVVRRRLSQAYADRIVLVRGESPWDRMFMSAINSGSPRESDLIPYWHIPEGTASIERITPMFGFSREVRRLDGILRVLSLYRLVFGQPRQQDLLENLLRRNYSDKDIAEIKRALIIDLAPINYLQPS